MASISMHIIWPEQPCPSGSPGDPGRGTQLSLRLRQADTTNYPRVTSIRKPWIPGPSWTNGECDKTWLGKGDPQDLWPLPLPHSPTVRVPRGRDGLTSVLSYSAQSSVQSGSGDYRARLACAQDPSSPPSLGKLLEACPSTKACSPGDVGLRRAAQLRNRGQDVPLSSTKQLGEWMASRKCCS